VASSSTDAEPTLEGQTRRSSWPRWSDESEPSKRCSRALDRSDESTLMVVSSSYLGTLVLVLDTRGLRVYTSSRDDCTYFSTIFLS